MHLKFGFLDTWINQGESLVDNVQILSGKRQFEEAYCGQRSA